MCRFARRYCQSWSACSRIFHVPPEGRGGVSGVRTRFRNRLWNMEVSLTHTEISMKERGCRKHKQKKKGGGGMVWTRTLAHVPRSSDSTPPKILMQDDRLNLAPGRKIQRMLASGPAARAHPHNLLSRAGTRVSEPGNTTSSPLFTHVTWRSHSGMGEQTAHEGG